MSLKERSQNASIHVRDGDCRNECDELDLHVGMDVLNERGLKRETKDVLIEQTVRPIDPKSKARQVEQPDITNTGFARQALGRNNPSEG